MRLLTLSFDDGFRKSFSEIAEIHARHGLSACLNVLAEGHTMNLNTLGEWHAPFPVGDFDLWRRLRSQGHEVMPHGLRHANKKTMPLEQAKSMIVRCLEIFEAEFPDLKRQQMIFNFPYNASSPELESWLAPRVRAFRTGGPALNPLPGPATKRINCSAWGPGNCEADLDKEVEGLLNQDNAWLAYNLHGLDKEGWGPVRASYLDERLGQWKKEGLRILNAGQALAL